MLSQAVTLPLIALLVLFPCLEVDPDVRRERGSAVRMPSLHWQVLKKAGVGAGTFWAIGNFFCTASVVMGGNAIVMAQVLVVLIVTCTSVGMFWYGEGGGLHARLVWASAMALTLVAMVMLGLEKAKAATPHAVPSDGSWSSSW